jgi:tetratricopeptide (TPR) repeat protein
MTKAVNGTRTLYLFACQVAVLALLVAVGIEPPFLLAQGGTPAQPIVPTPVSSVTAKSPPPVPELTPEETGDLHMARRRYQAAIEEYSHIVPKTARVWNKMGMAQQQMFSLADARKSYETSLRLDGKNPDVLNNLGTVHYAMKDYGNAEKLYRKALKLSPRSALISKNLGTDLLAENKFKKGWECYQTALSLDPQIFDRVNQFRVEEPTPTEKRGAMNYYLAKTYARAGNLDRAIDCLRRAMNEGFTDRKKIMADVEFASLHGLTAFQELFAEGRGR